MGTMAHMLVVLESWYAIEYHKIWPGQFRSCSGLFIICFLIYQRAFYATFLFHIKINCPIWGLAQDKTVLRYFFDYLFRESSHYLVFTEQRALYIKCGPWYAARAPPLQSDFGSQQKSDWRVINERNQPTQAVPLLYRRPDRARP